VRVPDLLSGTTAGIKPFRSISTMRRPWQAIPLHPTLRPFMPIVKGPVVFGPRPTQATDSERFAFPHWHMANPPENLETSHWGSPQDHHRALH
jgi:hypothetical protein